MAQITLTMQAHGVSAEKCDGCTRQFNRGETMSAVAYDDGDPAGWHCADCLAVYKNIGSFDPSRAREAAQSKASAEKGEGAE